MYTQMTDDEIRKFVKSVKDDSEGTVNLKGRTINYEIKSHFSGFQLRFQGKAWDAASQVKVKGRNCQSRAGAREHVLEDIIKKLGL